VTSHVAMEADDTSYYNSQVTFVILILFLPKRECTCMFLFNSSI